MLPRTYIGQWMRANQLNQLELRDELAGKLNGGNTSGWNYDELAVVEVAFQMAAHRLFRTDADVRNISAYVADLRRRITTATPPGQLEAEALIRAALGDQDVVINGISTLDGFTAQAAVFVDIALRLGLDEAAIERLIARAEKIAVERGWHPPLAARENDD